MERIKNLSQQGLCFPVLLILVFSIPDSVIGQIGVNCGSGAVVGQPYTMECTKIPETPNKGINVFLGDEVNSIVSCFPSKNCLSQNDSLYSVMTPHNESIFFTVLNITTDDIDKKLYCVDGKDLDPTSEPSCPLALVQTTAVPETSNSTRITDKQTNPVATTTESTDDEPPFPVGGIVGIVIAVIVVCGAVIIVIIVVIKKKSESERASL